MTSSHFEERNQCVDQRVATVQRTFWEIEEDAKFVAPLRGRAFSDTVIISLSHDTAVSSKDEDETSQSTAMWGSCDSDEDSAVSVDLSSQSVINFSEEELDTDCGQSLAPTPAGPPGQLRVPDLNSLQPPVMTVFPMLPVFASTSRRSRRLSRTAAGAMKKARAGAQLGSGEELPESDRTTVVIKHLPENCASELLCMMLDSAGFAGKYDFLYLPVNFKKWQRFQYCIVNFITSTDAQQAMSKLNTEALVWPNDLIAQVEVSWCVKGQGLQSLIEQYRNSPVMHHSVPDAFKPIHLQRGERVPFPFPTLRLNCPNGPRRHI